MPDLHKLANETAECPCLLAPNCEGCEINGRDHGEWCKCKGTKLVPLFPLLRRKCHIPRGYIEEPDYCRSLYPSPFLLTTFNKDGTEMSQDEIKKSILRGDTLTEWKRGCIGRCKGLGWLPIESDQLAVLMRALHEAGYNVKGDWYQGIRAFATIIYNNGRQWSDGYGDTPLEALVQAAEEMRKVAV